MTALQNNTITIDLFCWNCKRIICLLYQQRLQNNRTNELHFQHALIITIRAFKFINGVNRV